jgi:Phospholipase_D-nuclease N-terminal
MSFWDVITILLAVFLVAYLMVLYRIIVDVLRDDTLSGGSKALWIIVMIVVPVLSAVVYLAFRGEGMADRRQASRSARAARSGPLHG